MESVKLLIPMKGSLYGYFSCKRGVRQEEHLSHLLFCLAKDVLSRNISKLVKVGGIIPMKATRIVDIPSHILYEDDILVFYKGKALNVIDLK